MGKRGGKLESSNSTAQFKSLEQALSRRTDSLDLLDDVPSHKAITQRHVKNKLRELTDNLFYLLDNIPIGIALVSKKTLDIIFANRTFLDIFSFISMEEALTLSWKDDLPPDSYKHFLELTMQQRDRQYHPGYSYLQIKRKDGETRNVKTYLSDLPKDDRECSLLFFQDVTERVILEKAYQDDNEKRNLESLLEAFSYRIIEVQEDERRRISYELHDEVGQILTAIQLMLARSSKQSRPHTNPEHSETETLIKDAIERVRRLSLDLNPRTLEIQGLIPTLIEYFRRYKIWSGLTVNFKHTGLEKRGFPAAINNTVYRIIQESITNVARHADVNSVNVTIQVNRKTLSVRVADEGKGFNVKTLVIGRSGGLSGINERLLLLRGNLHIESAPGKGTRLTAEIPLFTNKDKKRLSE